MIDHSFAVIAYKDSPYLKDCLESLANQSVRSTIYISTSTPSNFIDELSREYDAEVIVTQPGLGIAHDWNFALQQAKTKYVTLAHQDDLYQSEYAEKCLSSIKKFNDALICFTGYSEIVDGKERSNTLMLHVKRFLLFASMPFKNNIRSMFWKRRSLSFGCPIPAPSVMYNRHNLNHFKFSDEFSINMDWDAWYRMANMKGRFVYESQSLLKHRIHLDSATTHGLQDNARQDEDLIMFKRFWPVSIAKFIAKIYALSYNSNKI